MIAVRRTGLRGALLATAVASSVMVAPSAFAAGSAGTFDGVDVAIKGGKTVALATCVNWAQDWAKKSEKDKQKYDKKRAAQSQLCDATATAIGADVKVEDVSVVVKKAGKNKAVENNVDISITGGDTFAIAACLNVLKGNTTADVDQKCTADATAIGSTVTVGDVKIVIK
jgi:hypothetical protein